MDDATRLRAAEQAVVKAALQRGWLTPAALGEARASAAADGTTLLRALQPKLDPGQRQALAEVHRAALALSGPAPTPRSALPAATAEGQAAAAAWSAPAAEAAPTRLGQYAIERELARGGMGVVYLARHVDLERPAAVKVLLPRPDGEGEDAAHRFAREARILEAVQHPAIVRLYEVGQDGARRWMALELVSGGSLEQRLATRGPLEPRAAAATIERVARALAVAHAKGLLHRDLKPANILLDDEGAAKLTDFGIAKPLDANTRQLTGSGVAVGTPAYVPPEQCGGGKPIDARADVYGLGATLHALLTGRPPFEGSYAHVMHQVLRAAPEPPSRRRPEVPAALDRITLRCLEKEPEARYPTVAELADDLARFLRGEAPVGAATPLGARLRRHPLALALLFAALVLSALAAAYLA